MAKQLCRATFINCQDMVSCCWKSVTVKKSKNDLCSVKHTMITQMRKRHVEKITHLHRPVPVVNCKHVIHDDITIGFISCSS